MGRYSRPTLYLVLICSALIIAIGAGWIIGHRSPEHSGTAFRPSGVETPSLEKRQVYLYFGDNQGRHLTAEQRIVDQPADPVEFGRRILSVLFRGPVQGGMSVLPPGADIRAFYLTGDGIAFVDFVAGSFDNHPGGVQGELLSIYSIVNTLVLNVDGIRTVKLLIGGQEAATLAGHVDLSHPFKADMLWVR